MERESRYLGSLLGLAVGDAIGAQVEFMPPGSFPVVTDMVGGGPHGLAPGQFTDDTSMALCLAASLVEIRRFDPVDQLRRYLEWLRKGYMSCTGRAFDVGNTTMAALRRFERTGEAYCGTDDPGAAGNGSIMRLAPVPLFFAADPAKAVEMSGLSSRTTHGARNAVDACRYLGALIAGAVAGADKDKILSSHFQPSLGIWEGAPLASAIDAIAHGSFKRPANPRGTGYVVDSLEAALWAFFHGESFEDGLLKAVNLGDDADTTAAVYGQLAGAYYGVEAIPSKWLRVIAMRSTIENLASGLHEMAWEPRNPDRTPAPHVPHVNVPSLEFGDEPLNQFGEGSV
ncbi:MAG: ADP-ribosylglycohydrolase family protein [Clostridia bacterium]|nr:ADP-ribosylglycohydrolase family protein [Clostridia bacterium]